MPLWQVEAVPAVQPVSPFARPQLPLLPQTLFTHCAALLQATLFAEAQVFVVALQSPLSQVGAPLLEQLTCRPSLTMPLPGVFFVRQVRLDRSQYCVAVVQSAST